ncbi:MAG: hypothetical protein LN410_01955 [Candidatus Thermoplasmatota archaeon]|nr:hypothetical protein [Candidatus Thermoplasmatota archaeon]
MVTTLQVIAVFHAFFGVLWVGANVYIDVAWYRPWKNTSTTGELKVWQRILRPTGPFLGITAILVIITGFIYMFTKYGTDFGVIWAGQSGRLIIISLILVAIAFILAVTLTSRLSIQLIRLELPEDPGTPISSEAKGLMDGVMRASAIGTTIIIVVLILMILATTGGV